MPPTSGVGRSWTRRSSGSTTHPRCRANAATNGVVTRVTTVATAPMSRYPEIVTM
ncbi:MAG: hypothetical protein R2705_12540 [Ilumatobacteraceae bacterium]